MSPYLVRSLRAITKLEICSKHQPPEPPFSLDQWTRAKLLGFGFVDISVFFKNVRDLPQITAADKCHDQVELQLFAECGGPSRSRVTGHLLIQSQLPNRVEKS